MESQLVSYGTRISYIKEDSLMLSTNIYSNGHQTVRILIDLDEMVYKLIDPVTGVVFKESTNKVTNVEVLQRKAKRGLMSYLKISFDKETRTNSDE